MEQRNSSIEIYRSPEGNIELNVKLLKFPTLLFRGFQVFVTPE